MELKSKLKLYFFDPKLDEDKYTKLFHKYNGQNTYKKYAPLYLLRRQTLLLSGKLIKFPEPPIWQTPYFSAILLANIGISGIIELTEFKRNTEKEEHNYPRFYERYFGKDIVQLAGLRAFRNALEHNNFQLFTRAYRSDKNGTAKIYELIASSISLENATEIDSIKIAFTLTRMEGANFVDGPVLENEYKNKKYAFVRYTIDPFRFLEKFEEAIMYIQKDVEKDSKLLKNFDESVTTDNWMHVSD